MDKWVYLFNEGDRSLLGLLGGKGAGVAEMSRAGLPVPPGFIITTAACNAYYEHDKLFPEGMWSQSKVALAAVEEQAGKRFGSAANPLLVSVRSGAPVSMPGMMDTVLNLGLNAQTLSGLAQLTGDEAFAWDAYRRFVQMFGEIVLDVPKDKLDRASDAIRARANGQRGAELSVATSRLIVERYKEIIFGEARQEVPEDPKEQLRMAIAAVFDSWTLEKRRPGLPRWRFRAHRLHVLLDGPLGHLDIQLQHLAPNPFRPPQPIVTRHAIENAIASMAATGGSIKAIVSDARR